MGPGHIRIRILVGNADASIFRDLEGWIPGNLPQKAVRIGKISRITAPKGLQSRLDQLCTRCLSLCKNRVHLFTMTGVVCERHPSSRFPCAEQPSHVNQLSKMMRVVIGDEQCFAQDSLAISPRDFSEQVSLGIADQLFHRVQIVLK